MKVGTGRHYVRLHIHIKSSFEEDDDVKFFSKYPTNDVRIYISALILDLNACLHVIINQFTASSFSLQVRVQAKVC